MRALLPLAILAILAGCSGSRTVRSAGYRVVTSRPVAPVAYGDYITRMLRTPGSPESGLYIPGYAYYQGFIYTPKHVSVVGQLRVIGGVAATEEVFLQSGAMVTTNPDAMRNRVRPSKFRYRVTEWREVP